MADQDPECDVAGEPAANDSVVLEDEDTDTSTSCPFSDTKTDNNDIECVSVNLQAGNEDEANVASPEECSVPENKSQMQSLEIDIQREGGKEQNGDESFNSEEDDMEHLLGGGDNKTSDDKDQSTPRRQLICGVCEKPETVGNMKIFLPSRFAKTGWGIAGPHWFGPLCVLLLVSFASHYFIQISARKVGPITALLCILFTIACAYNLGNVAYRDPGVVKLQPTSQRPQTTSDEDQRLQYRWCDRCQIFQPPDGAHCSDCNVCVAGFDQ